MYPFTRKSKQPEAPSFGSGQDDPASRKRRSTQKSSSQRSGQITSKKPWCCISCSDIANATNPWLDILLCLIYFSMIVSCIVISIQSATSDTADMVLRVTSVFPSREVTVEEMKDPNWHIYRNWYSNGTANFTIGTISKGDLKPIIEHDFTLYNNGTHVYDFHFNNRNNYRVKESSFYEKALPINIDMGIHPYGNKGSYHIGNGVIYASRDIYIDVTVPISFNPYVLADDHTNVVWLCHYMKCTFWHEVTNNPRNQLYMTDHPNNISYVHDPTCITHRNTYDFTVPIVLAIILAVLIPLHIIYRWIYGCCCECLT